MKEWMLYLFPTYTFSMAVGYSLQIDTPYDNLYKCWVAMAVQAIIFMIFTILIDRHRIHAFRGQDQKIESLYKPLLDER
jgi:phosphotransferase system  glucose/maltose/N-acetylglucosamine-specific IIC component